MVLGLAAAGSLVACGEHAIRNETSDPKGMAMQSVKPEWSPGDVWRVEYRLQIPSTVMAENPAPPPPEVRRWTYKVEAVREHEAVLSAEREGDEPLRYHIVYRMPDFSFARAFELKDGGEMELITSGAPGSAFAGWNPPLRVLLDWPDFDAGDQQPFHPVPDDPDFIWNQQTGPGERGTVRFTMSTDDGTTIERSWQEWISGEPWWRTAKVEFEEAGDPASRTVRLEGYRID